MKKVKRWRYYCDYCKKVGGSAGHMKIHEKHCTANPNRSCRMCDTLQVEQKSINVLKEKLHQLIKNGTSHYSRALFIDVEINKKALDKFRDFTNGCPACMLAAIRQSDEIINFDFKKECEAFWADINERNYQEESCY